MRGRVAVYRRRGGAIAIDPMAITNVGLMVSTGIPVTMADDASNVDLGIAVAEALGSADRQVGHPASQKAFRQMASRLNAALGVKSTAQFMRECVMASASSNGRMIRVVPTSNRGLRGGFVDRRDAAIEVSTADTESLGAVVRQALDLSQ
jgi:hypothetical protein